MTDKLILYCVRWYGYSVAILSDGNIIDEYHGDCGSNWAETEQFALQTAEEWREQLGWDCEIDEDTELMDDLDEHYSDEEEDDE